MFYANIGDHPQKIIDIGTGIGKSLLRSSIKYSHANKPTNRNLAHRWYGNTLVYPRAYQCNGFFFF